MFFQQGQFLVGHTWGYSLSRDRPYVEIACGSSAEDEAFRAFVSDLVEQLEAMDVPGRLVRLPVTLALDGHFVQLPVMPANLPLQEDLAIRHGVRVSADASRINGVGLRQSVANAGVLCDVSVGQGYVVIRRLQPVVERPAHHAHECGIAKRHASPYAFGQGCQALVVALVACLAQRYEVVRGVPSRLPALDVMDVQYLVP